MKYYMVVCSRGHQGTGHSTEIKFAIKANNLLEAQDITRKMPSVKHTRMPLMGKEITFEEYQEYRSVSAYDRYGHHETTRQNNAHKKKNNKRRR